MSHTTKPWIPATLSALALAVAACSEAPERQAPGASAAGTAAVPAAPAQVSATPDPTAATMEHAEDPSEVSADVIDRDGNRVGSLVLQPLENGVRLDLHVEGLQPGPHAVHFHTTGRCATPDFASAGQHYDPADADHGMTDTDSDFADQDHHAGDMLNQTADDNGQLDALLTNRSVTLNGPENALLDDDGAALIVHAQGDDYETQPAGDAGARVACAEIVSTT